MGCRSVRSCAVFVVVCLFVCLLQRSATASVRGKTTGAIATSSASRYIHKKGQIIRVLEGLNK